MADVAAGSEAGVSVLVVDDHDVVHWGFRVLLDRQPWVERCDAAADAETALELIGRHHHDVALVDLFLGQSSGAELCGEIHAIPPIPTSCSSPAPAASRRRSPRPPVPPASSPRISPPRT